MTKKYPKDILYQNILAETYLKNEKLPEAIQLFHHALLADELNQNIRSDAEIAHRAFCNECFRPIQGIRQKCTLPACRNYDCCTDCLNRSGGSSRSCLHHPRIILPSQETLSSVLEPAPAPVPRSRSAQYPVFLPRPASSRPAPATAPSPGPAFATESRSAHPPAVKSAGASVFLPPPAGRSVTATQAPRPAPATTPRTTLAPGPPPAVSSVTRRGNYLSMSINYRG